MKYIRTKDGIYIAYIDKSTTLEEVNSAYKEDKAISIADTIEELCDELYFVEDETNIPLRVNRLHGSFDKGKKLTECCLEIGDWVTYLKKFFKKGCIKGAIFTSQGIIYVAKLNEEGEWELL